MDVLYLTRFAHHIFVSVKGVLCTRRVRSWYAEFLSKVYSDTVCCMEAAKSLSKHHHSVDYTFDGPLGSLH